MTNKRFLNIINCGIPRKRCVMTVCFIGHRTVEKKEELVSLLKKTVKELIEKGAIKFLFGSMSEFNELALDVVTELKKEYTNIIRVYVRAGYKEIDENYEKYLLRYYENTYFPTQLERAGKSSYVKRNYEMIDKSACCVFYYNENYVAPLKESRKRNMLVAPRRNSGTKVAYNYAIKKKKQIINLYQ